MTFGCTLGSGLKTYVKHVRDGRRVYILLKRRMFWKNDPMTLDVIMIGFRVNPI